MQNLINALISGRTEFKDDGVIVQHPPTAVQIRAAKIVSELNNQNVANQQILVNQQQQITELLVELEKLNARDVEQKANIAKLVVRIDESLKLVLEEHNSVLRCMAQLKVLEDANTFVNNPVTSSANLNTNRDDTQTATSNPVRVPS